MQMHELTQMQFVCRTCREPWSEKAIFEMGRLGCAIFSRDPRTGLIVLKRCAMCPRRPGRWVKTFMKIASWFLKEALW
jgi:hypothetical protein